MNTFPYTPFHDYDCEIYGLNTRTEWYVRETLHFEMHMHQYYKLPRWARYYRWLQDNQEKLILQAPDEDLPQATVFSREDSGWEYDITSSVMWMILYARQQRPDRVLLTGIDLCLQEEYVHQRNGVFHLIDTLLKEGVDTLLPVKSLLFRDEEGFDLESSQDSKFNLIKKVPRYEARNTGITYGFWKPPLKSM